MRRLCLCTQFSDGGKRCAFVGGIALHDFNQARHQIVPALELHVDIGPSGARLVAQPHQPVEREHGP